MKLITWNVQWCRGLDGAVSPRRIVQDARSLADFDVLCLQEVADNFPGLAGSTGEDQFAAIAALLPGFTPVAGICVDTPGPAGRRSRFGNMILSRLPVQRVRVLHLPWPSDAEARRSMPRCAVEAVIDTSMGPVRVITTHLEYFSRIQRSAQAAALLLDHAQACSRARDGQAQDASGGPFTTWPEPADAILCGDFNMPANDPAYAQLTTQAPTPALPFADVWRHAHPGSPQPPTADAHQARFWPEPTACDFVFATPRLLRAIRRVEVDARTTASDHQPVLVEWAAH